GGRETSSDFGDRLRLSRVQPRDERSVRQGEHQACDADHHCGRLCSNRAELRNVMFFQFLQGSRTPLDRYPCRTCILTPMMSRWIAIVVAAITLAACSPKKMGVSRMADALSSTASAFTR